MADPLTLREKRDLVNARALWYSSPVRNSYRYELRLSCFCPTELTQWNRITVIDGVVVDVQTEQGAAVSRDQWSSYATVDRLFATLEADGDSELEDITARFDPQYGYPVEMNFFYSPEIQDAGASYFARNLQAVARAGGSGQD